MDTRGHYEQKRRHDEGISAMADLDFITEIRIAQFWRKQLGEYEYVNRNPDDLRRWYVALETRGPEEIRDYLIERTGRHPPGQITGIVAEAPHPTREIVELWLASHNKPRTAPLWYGMAAFLIASLLITTNIVGCQNLKNLNTLATNPPAPPQLQPAQGGTAPQALSTVPVQLPAPANRASPPTGNIPSMNPPP
jgi:hypothetical protein